MHSLDELAVELKELVSKYAPAVHLSVLLRAYSILKGKKLPFEEYGYKDAESFIRENFVELVISESETHKGQVVVRMQDEACKSESNIANSLLGKNDCASGSSPTKLTSAAANGSTPISTANGPIPTSTVNGPTPISTAKRPASNSTANATQQTATTSKISLPTVNCLSYSSTPNGLPLPLNSYAKPFLKKKIVPVQFRTFLARILDQYPLGISARDYVGVFLKTSGSPLSYQMYGYPGHVSMFRDLPDVFRIEQDHNGEIKLFPIDPNAGRTIQASLRSNPLDMESEDAMKSTLQKQQQTTPESAVQKYETPLGDIVTVQLGDGLFVPTGCLASFLGFSEDNILMEFEQHGITVERTKFLSADVVQHNPLLKKIALTGCPFVINADGTPKKVISLVPIESCNFIYTALTEAAPETETLLNDIERLLKISHGV